MSEQEDVQQGGIPPKVSPLTAAPTAPAASGAPRPITVRLKPAVPAAAADSAAPTVAQPSPRATSRVPVPEEVAKASMTAVRPVTVRLRPLAAPGGAPGEARAPGSTQSISKMDTAAAGVVSTLQPQHPPVPGSNPLPSGPKPLSPYQQHAAKSKTSRISLESAIGMAPVGEDKGGPKTIRLKRPSDLTTPAVVPIAKSPTTVVRQTSRIPDSALPAAEAATASTATVTQKKTLKIKRPGVKDAEAAAAAEGGAFSEGVQMTPLSPADFAEHQEPSPAFTAAAAIAALAATVVVFATMWFLAAHAIGSVAGKNAVAFIEGPDLPCPGRMLN